MQNQSQVKQPGDLDNQTREEKLSVALLQLIELAAMVRFRQRRWEDTYGSEAKMLKKIAENQLDQVLHDMGVDETTDYKRVKIKFLKELSIDEFKNLLK